MKKELKLNPTSEIEFNVCSEDEVFVQRLFLGKTKRDIEIEKLKIPVKPFWLKVVVKLIRFYQKKISKKIGNRCVFDPSCSHYAEIAFREKGLFKGTLLTINRLYRCRPNHGGIDELK